LFSNKIEEKIKEQKAVAILTAIDRKALMLYSFDEID
jgi:hypothetical protein